VTEAACKTIVKQQLDQSGMRWKEKGARVILSLRTLVKSPNRWAQFWGKVDQYGFPVGSCCVKEIIRFRSTPAVGIEAMFFACSGFTNSITAKKRPSGIS
jgi:hypothetical protein